MTRGEAYRLIKVKLRGFCESTHEPSADAARALIWQLNDLVDHVTTESGPILKTIKARAFEQLSALGLLIRRCRRCEKNLTVCKCTGKRASFLDVDRRILKELEAL